MSSLIIIIFFLSIVQAQEPIVQTDPTANIVVREHFLTKKEIKDEIGKQSEICMRSADNMISKGFDEVGVIVGDTVNKALFKIIIVFVGAFVFAGATWYYIRLKLDNRLARIKSLRELAKETTKKDGKGVK